MATGVGWGGDSWSSVWPAGVRAGVAGESWESGRRRDTGIYSNRDHHARGETSPAGGCLQQQAWVSPSWVEQDRPVAEKDTQREASHSRPGNGQNETIRDLGTCRCTGELRGCSGDWKRPTQRSGDLREESAMWLECGLGLLCHVRVVLSGACLYVVFVILHAFLFKKRFYLLI